MEHNNISNNNIYKPMPRIGDLAPSFKAVSQ